MVKKTLVMVCAAAFAASADTVNLRFDGTAAGRNVKITFGENQLNVFAGQLRHTFSEGTGWLAGSDGAQITFCTDLTQHVTRDGAVYERAPLTDLPDAPGVASMGEEQAQLLRDLYAHAGGAQLASEPGNAYAAAFQLMVWEIVWDYTAGEALTQLDLAGGDFSARKTNGAALESDVLSAFAGLRAGLGTNSAAPGLIGLASGSAQDQLFVVPTPGTGALAALGMLLAAPRTRRNHA